MRRNNKKGKLPQKRQFTLVLHRKRHTQRSFIRSFCVCLDGGAKGIRTPDLLNAIQTRYQLRHNPMRDYRHRITYFFDLGKRFRRKYFLERLESAEVYMKDVRRARLCGGELFRKVMPPCLRNRARCRRYVLRRMIPTGQARKRFYDRRRAMRA